MTLRNPVLLALLGAAAFTFISPGPDAQAGHMMGNPSPQLVELKQDVKALKLYHTLNMEAAQEAEMEALLGKFHSDAEALKSRADDLEARSIKILKNAKKELNRKGEISPDTQAQLDELRSEKQAIHGEMRDLAKPTMKAAMVLLTDAQKAELREIKKERAQNQKLDRLRAMDDATFEQHLAERKARALEKGVPEAKFDARAEEMIALLTEIRAVPDAEWDAKRDDYAAQLAEMRGKKKGAKGEGRGHGEMSGHREHRGGEHRGHGGKKGRHGEKLGKILLSEAFYDVLTSQ